MSLSVQNRAEHVATFRFVHVFLMETLARWVPTTAEMEVKVAFGRHIWDLAQQADALGKRTYELRAPLQFSLRPTEVYVGFLEEFAKTSGTPEKIQGFYDVVLPALAMRYKKYLDETDQLLDEPTVRVVNRILDDFGRMQRESRQLQEELPQLGQVDQAWLNHLRRHEATEPVIVLRRPATTVA
jgi:hypothetical protein